MRLNWPLDEGPQGAQGVSHYLGSRPESAMKDRITWTAVSTSALLT